MILSMGKFHFVKHLRNVESLKALSMIMPRKIQVGRRPGPQPVLTRDEEKWLVEWAVEMAKIGYGQTR